MPIWDVNGPGHRDRHPHIVIPTNAKIISMISIFKKQMVLGGGEEKAL